MPVLIGWAAVTGSLGLAAGGALRGGLLLDPAALLGAGDALPRRLRARPACRCCRSCATPVVVARRIVGYSWLMVATSLLLWPLATSWVYGAVAVGAGAWFLAAAHRLLGHVRSADRGPGGRGVEAQARPALPPVQLLPGAALRRGRRRRAGPLRQGTASERPGAPRRPAGGAGPQRARDGVRRPRRPTRATPRVALATCREQPAGRRGRAAAARRLLRGRAGRGAGGSGTTPRWTGARTTWW